VAGEDQAELYCLSNSKLAAERFDAQFLQDTAANVTIALSIWSGWKANGTVHSGAEILQRLKVGQQHIRVEYRWHPMALGEYGNVRVARNLRNGM